MPNDKENTSVLSPVYRDLSNIPSIQKRKDLFEKLGGKPETWPYHPRKIEGLTEEQKQKIAFYNDLNTFFKGNIPSDLKDQWTNLNNRPNITQEEYQKLKNNQGPNIEGLPSDWKDQLARLKDLEDKLDKVNKEENKDPNILALKTLLLSEENKNLWDLVNNKLVRIIEEVVPKAEKIPKN